MKTLTKKTHIATIRQANRQGMERVCHLLQFTEQQYCNYLFDQYCKFINLLYNDFPDSVASNILYSKLYRGLFNNAAARRDEAEFIPYATDVTEEVMVINTDGRLEICQTIPLGGAYLVDEWKHIHSYKRLMMDDQFINQFNHVLNLIKIY